MFSAWAKEMGFEPAPAVAPPVDEKYEEEDKEEEEPMPEHWDYRPPLFSDSRGFIYEVMHPSFIYSTSSPMSKKVGRRTPGQLVRVYDYNISRSWCRVVTETRHGNESGWMALHHDTLGPMLELMQDIPKLRPVYDAVDPSLQLPTASSNLGASAPASIHTGAADPEQDQPLTGPPKAWTGDDAPLVMAPKPMPARPVTRARGRGRGSQRDDEGVAESESKKATDAHNLGYGGFERAGDGGLGIDVTSAVWEPNAVIKPVRPAVREALLAQEKEEAAAAAAAKAAKEREEAQLKESQRRAAQPRSDEGMLYEVIYVYGVNVRVEPAESAKVVTRRVRGQVLEVFDFDETGCWGLIQFKWKKGVQMGWVLLSSAEGEVLLQPYWLLEGEDRQDVLKR